MGFFSKIAGCFKAPGPAPVPDPSSTVAGPPRVRAGARAQHAAGDRILPRPGSSVPRPAGPPRAPDPAQAAGAAGPAAAQPQNAPRHGNASQRLFGDAVPPVAVRPGESRDAVTVAAMARHGITYVPSGMDTQTKGDILQALQQLNGPGATEEQTRENMRLAIELGSRNYDAAMTLIRNRVVSAKCIIPDEKLDTMPTAEQRADLEAGGYALRVDAQGRPRLCSDRHTFLHSLAIIGSDTPLGAGMQDGVTPKSVAQRVSDLVLAGADVNARDVDGRTPLELALRDNPDRELVESLLANGADRIALDHKGNTILHRAIKEGRPEVITGLLATFTPEAIRAKHVNLICRDGRKSAIDLACARLETGELRREVLSILINNGIERRHIDTAFDCAIKNNDAILVADLLAAGAYRNDPEAGPRSTQLARPLKAAAQSCSNPEVINVLVEAGAEVQSTRVRNPRSRTLSVLETAASHNPNVAVVAALIDAGADPARATPGPELTPAHLAALNNHNPAVLRLLLERGGSPTAQNVHGMRPMHYALMHESPELRREMEAVLLAAGAAPYVPDHHRMIRR